MKYNQTDGPRMSQRTAGKFNYIIFLQLSSKLATKVKAILISDYFI